MIKIRYILALTLLSFSVFGLFQVKFKAQKLHDEVYALKAQLADEKDSIHVLKAEWAYLNQPERLLRLSQKFLDVSEVKAEQVLPAKPGSIITTAQASQNLDIVENNNLVKITSRSKKIRKQTRWNYRERPSIRTSKERAAAKNKGIK